VEPNELYDAILNGDSDAATEATKAALAAGKSPADLISGIMIPAMDEVGRLFETEEYYFPELLMSGQAMKAGMELIRPLLVASGVKPEASVVVGTVHGDLHDIGKNLVISMLEGAGFEVCDLGIDVPPEKFVEAIRTHKPNFICMSALLTVTMPNMKTTIDAITAAGLRDQVKILIGGAPVNLQYANEIGADGYSETANEAVTLLRKLMGKAA
jgi:5-methyltetrahydrofolate--homocysteine methyltransferase